MSEIYEEPSILAEYLLFHYGSADEILPKTVVWPDGMRSALDFAVRTSSHFPTNSAGRGLDLGCAVGRSTFEMAKNCDEVIGIDFSNSFVNAAEAIRDGSSVPYERRDEGHVRTSLVARRPGESDPARVSFSQGDAMNLPPDLGTFDRVHAANLLCRLRDPLLLLRRLPELVNPGGTLVLATPCTWLEAFTPPTNWPEADTADWLAQHLGGSFELVESTDEPFLIRETARKFQWTRSLLTVWERK